MEPLHKFSVKKDKQDLRDYQYRKLADQIPTLETVHDSDLTGAFPPVWDQGKLGSCQSFAIDAIDAYIRRYSFTPSHLFEYYNVRSIEGTTDQDSGGSLRDTCSALAKFGVCEDVFWPYNRNRLTQKPPKSAYDNANADNDRIYDYYRVNDIDEIRHALSNGHPPLIGIDVYENMETHKTMDTGVIPLPGGENLGGHALVIVGHHDSDMPSCKASNFVWIKRPTGYVKIRNSWGNGIGLGGSGYFLCPYETLDELLMDAWVIIR